MCIRSRVFAYGCFMANLFVDEQEITDGSIIVENPICLFNEDGITSEGRTWLMRH